MKTFEELKKDLLANPDNYDFDEDELDEVIDLFEQHDLDETDFTKSYYADFDKDNLVDFLSTYMQDIDTNDIDLYNEYIEENRYEEYLYSMNDLDDSLADYSPTEIIEMALGNNDFSISDEYYYFNSRGDLVSSNSVEDVADDVIGLNLFSEWIIENKYPELLDDIVLNVLRALYE